MTFLVAYFPGVLSERDNIILNADFQQLKQLDLKLKTPA